MLKSCLQSVILRQSGIAMFTYSPQLLTSLGLLHSDENWTLRSLVKLVGGAGTNFLVRAQAIMEVGGSPMYTMTEDYALGMELKKFGWHCRYVQEYLAIGEAPHEVRNMYQQRSRWTKVSRPSSVWGVGG